VLNIGETGVRASWRFWDSGVYSRAKKKAMPEFNSSSPYYDRTSCTICLYEDELRNISKFDFISLLVTSRNSRQVTGSTPCLAQSGTIRSFNIPAFMNWGVSVSLIDTHQSSEQLYALSYARIISILTSCKFKLKQYNILLRAHLVNLFVNQVPVGGPPVVLCC